ncbi:hypothetical protein AMECASPLE_009966 [Ameca splendens]|uniref:Uncharacterized protein n=1 Tax=Ameca splendens TaxID=208324 RepID=A0ABV0XDE9_9TELE
MYCPSAAVLEHCWVLQRALYLMLLRGEREAAVGCGVWCSSLWWHHLKAGKEEVQLLCLRSVTVSSTGVSLVFGELLDPLLHLSAVVAVQVVLDLPPIVRM